MSEFKPTELTAEEFAKKPHKGPVMGIGARSKEDIDAAIDALAEGLKRGCAEQGIENPFFHTMISTMDQMEELEQGESSDLNPDFQLPPLEGNETVEQGVSEAS